MWKVQKPRKTTTETLFLCASNLEDQIKKARIESAAEQLEEAATEYESFGVNKSLHLVGPTEFVGNVTKEEMWSLYNDKFAKKGQPGRKIYDEIKLAAPNQRCPHCGCREVNLLDHHLPKGSYCILSISPINLVPACSVCNHIKGVLVPSNDEQQWLHPYFDDVENVLWLKAEVQNSSPAAILFYADPPQNLGKLRARILFQFDRLGLAEIYATKAAEEMSGIASYLDDLYKNTGEHGVRDHLNQLAMSHSKSSINSWRAAMYLALSISEWYCNEGFKIGYVFGCI